MKNVIDVLEERGFIESMSSEELRQSADQPLKLYIGFDPTADSLHLGNMVGIIAAHWFQKFGHSPVIILGGATGRIGDPSGRSIERPLLADETIAHNVEKIKKNLEKIFSQNEKTDNLPLIVDNNEWYRHLLLIDFLRDVGKHFRMSTMLAKESVRTRLESEEGLSFTEFSYQIFQGYDFYHLYTHFGVVLQVGGSDQWGNITSGIELIRRLCHKPAFGITFPLLTRSDGKKFGKSEERAIWLSEERLSPYKFYQYLYQISDPDVTRLMRMLTVMDLEEILFWEKEMEKPSYSPNSAQKRLAEEITRFIHGEEGLRVAQRVTEAAAPGAKASLDLELLREISADLPNVVLHRTEVVNEKYVDLLAKTGILSSKGEAIRLIQNGGAYLNEEKIEETGFRIGEKHLIGDEFILIGIGKKKKFLIHIPRDTKKLLD